MGPSTGPLPASSTRRQQSNSKVQLLLQQKSPWLMFAHQNSPMPIMHCLSFAQLSLSSPLTTKRVPLTQDRCPLSLPTSVTDGDGIVDHLESPWDKTCVFCLKCVLCTVLRYVSHWSQILLELAGELKSSSEKPTQEVVITYNHVFMS